MSPLDWPSRVWFASMPDSSQPESTDTQRAEAETTGAELDADLREFANRLASESRAFLRSVTDIAAGSAGNAALPLLLLALADVSAAGALLGAIGDVVPAERFEPDVGPDTDVDPLRDALAVVLDGIDEYADLPDPLLDNTARAATVSGDIATIAGSLTLGLAHYEAGQLSESLWWWQFSYLQTWGERAASALRVLVTLLGHVRLDVSAAAGVEAELDALLAED